MRRRVEEGARRSARSPPGGVQARTGISTASAVWRARAFAKRSARRLPGEPVALTMTRRTGNTESPLPFLMRIVVPAYATLSGAGGQTAWQDSCGFWPTSIVMHTSPDLGERSRMDVVRNRGVSARVLLAQARVPGPGG